MPTATIASSPDARKAMLQSFYEQAAEAKLQKWVDGLPDRLYHDHRLGYSSSDLKTILEKSPAHLEHDLKNKKQPTPAMKLGSAVHAMTLSPDEKIWVEPTVSRRSAAGKKEHEDFEKEHEGELIVTEKMYAQASYMTHAISQHSEARELLRNGVAEQSLFFNLPISELQFRARPDYLTENYMVELKTSSDASRKAFAKDIANMYYHVSLAHYLRGIERIHGTMLSDVYFIVVESAAPWSVAVYKASEQMLEVGFREWVRAVDMLNIAVASENWVGYNYHGVEELDLPNWAVPKDMREEL